MVYFLYSVVGIPMYFCFFTKWWGRSMAWIFEPNHGSFQVVLEEPHYFRCIHRTTTKSDDLSGSTLSLLQYHRSASCDIWVWFNVWEDLDSYTVAAFVQLVNNEQNQVFRSIWPRSIITRSLDRIVRSNFWRNLNHCILFLRFPCLMFRRLIAPTLSPTELCP